MINFKCLGRISTSEGNSKTEILGGITQIEEIVRINKLDEIVFCSQDIAAGDIIEVMLSIANPTFDFKIAPPESVAIIGSNSIDTTGDLYVLDLNSLSKGVNKREKRLFDILSSIALLLLSPIIVFFINNTLFFYKNTIRVLFSRYTWVGVMFDRHQNIKHTELKKGILLPSEGIKRNDLSFELKQRMNIAYAKDYKVLNDARILLKNIHQLGRKV
jgi:hypothetical protein